MKKELSPEGRKEFEWLLTRYPQKRACLLPTLRIIEREFGRVDPEGIELAASLVGMPPSEVLGVVSFYTHYKRETDGKYVIWACKAMPSPFITETATRVFRGVDEAIEYFSKKGYFERRG